MRSLRRVRSLLITKDTPLRFPWRRSALHRADWDLSRLEVRDNRLESALRWLSGPNTTHRTYANEQGIHKRGCGPSRETGPVAIILGIATRRNKLHHTSWRRAPETGIGATPRKRE